MNNGCHDNHGKQQATVYSSNMSYTYCLKVTKFHCTSLCGLRAMEDTLPLPRPDRVKFAFLDHCTLFVPTATYNDQKYLALIKFV